MEASSTSSCCLFESGKRNAMKYDFLKALNAVKNMFKIIENQNGITSVFSSSTGKLVCTVRNNISLESEPKPPLKSANYLKPTKPNCCQPQNVKSKRDPSPDESLPLLPPEEPEFDYDCVDDVTFFGFLDLVPTKKLENVPLKELRNQSPFKSRHCSPANEAKKEFNVRLFEKIGFSSNLARHCSKCIKRNAISPLFTINNYEKFCVMSLPNNSSLRNREQLKDFPITYRPKKGHYTHYFPLSKADKVEKQLRLKTHLDKRSRSLKSECKKIVLRVKKLTSEEIANLIKIDRLSKSNFAGHELKPCFVPLTRFEQDLIYNKPFFYLGNVKISHSSVNLLKKKLPHVKSYSHIPNHQLNGIQTFSSSICDTPKKEKEKAHQSVSNSHPATVVPGSTGNGHLSDGDDDDDVQIIHIKSPLPISSCTSVHGPAVHIIRPFRSQTVTGSTDLLPSIPPSYQTSSRMPSPLSSPSLPHWKLQLPVTVDASQWTFICHRCNMKRIYTDKDLASQQITQHLLNHQLANPEKEIRQCCIKYGNHLEVTVQAFVTD